VQLYRVHLHYQRTLGRDDVDETRSYRAVIEDAVRTGRSHYPQAFFDDVNELVTQVDHRGFDLLPLHPSYRRCVDEVRQQGIEATFGCHRVFNCLALWHRLWRVEPMLAYRAPDDLPAVHAHDGAHQP